VVWCGVVWCGLAVWCSMVAVILENNGEARRKSGGGGWGERNAEET